MSQNETLYKVRFTSEGELYDVYVKSVGESDLFGFIVLEELVFGETAAVVVDPSQERLKTEFEGVKRTYVPIHNVLRIDEVEKRGVSKVIDRKSPKGNVSQFPSPIYTPTKEH